MPKTKVLIRIYDTTDQHLEDVHLSQSQALYLAPGGYLGDYDWARSCGISHSLARQVRSVGVPHENLLHEDLQEPWISIWVDAI
jgi:hypothetical protein